jgi:hypothetical protein
MKTSECLDPRLRDLGTSMEVNGLLDVAVALLLGKTSRRFLVGDWVVAKASVDFVDNKMFFTLPGLELHPNRRQSHSHPVVPMPIVPLG